MDRKLGIIAECVADAEPKDLLPLIRDEGFSTVFTGKIEAREVEKVKSLSDKLGLKVEFIHAPFSGINDMWKSGMAYLGVYNGIQKSVESAAACGIPSINLHVSSGWRPPEVCDLGLARYDSIVEYAIKKGVKIAFENLRKVGNFAYLMDRYDRIPEVGFCYDVGHEHCYTATVDIMDICGDKAVCTHIHDNFGRDRRDFSCDPDIHLLPFDGNIDYQRVVNKLDEYEYSGSIMLEVFNHRQYSDWTKENFVREAFIRAQKINAMSK